MRSHQKNSSHPHLDGVNCKSQCIGKGAYATVYVVMDTPLSLPVAHKVIDLIEMSKKEMSSIENAKLKCDRETAIMQQLKQPNARNVMQVIKSSFSKTASQYVIIMPYMEKGSLEQWIKNKTYFPKAQQLNIALQIAQGVAYLHSINVLHRDLKPANILFNKDFVVHICDFGFAIVKDNIEKNNNDGEVYGTPAFLAPELLTEWKHRKQQYKATAAADVYSMAVTLLCLFTQVLNLYPQFGIDALYMYIAYGKQRAKIPKDYTARETALITNAWANNPQDRSSAQEIITQLSLARLDMFENDYINLKNKPIPDSTISKLQDNYIKKLQELYQANPHIKDDLQKHAMESELLAYKVESPSHFFSKLSALDKAIHVLAMNGAANVVTKTNSL